MRRRWPITARAHTKRCLRVASASKARLCAAFRAPRRLATSRFCFSPSSWVAISTLPSVREATARTDAGAHPPALQEASGAGRLVTEKGKAARSGTIVVASICKASLSLACQSHGHAHAPAPAGPDRRTRVLRLPLALAQDGAQPRWLLGLERGAQGALGVWAATAPRPGRASHPADRLRSGAAGTRH